MRKMKMRRMVAMQRWQTTSRACHALVPTIMNSTGVKYCDPAQSSSSCWSDEF
jgi:hypothetical protein